MRLSFEHVIPHFQSFFKGLNKSGLGGNIVEDKPAHVDHSVGQLARWTGVKHRLVFGGAPKSYWVEIQQEVEGVWVTSHRCTDPERMERLAMDFASKEG